MTEGRLREQMNVMCTIVVKMKTGTKICRVIMVQVEVCTGLRPLREYLISLHSLVAAPADVPEEVFSHQTPSTPPWCTALLQDLVELRVAPAVTVSRASPRGLRPGVVHSARLEVAGGMHI